jgi:hypothetical protein
VKTCPRKKSGMTPCVITDGENCYTLDGDRNAICVGCERGPATTGVPVDLIELQRKYDAYVRRDVRRWR